MQLLTDLSVPSLEKENIADILTEQKKIIEEIHQVLELTDEPPKIEKNIESKALKRDKKEISDAILEVVESTEKDFDLELEIERERQIYAALEKEEGGLDYSTLHYGKIARPLAIQWSYKDYEPDNQGFKSKETISMKEVEEIIEEKAFGDLFNKGESFLRSKTDYSFQYWKLFNAALNIMKYEWAFT